MEVACTETSEAGGVRPDEKSQASSPDLYQHQCSQYLTGVRITNTSHSLCFQMLIQPSTNMAILRRRYVWYGIIITV